MAKKKITLEVLATLITNLSARMQRGFAASDKKFASLDSRMEQGFGAVASDIADIKRDMATKEQVIALHTQVASIETQLRGMKPAKLVSRVADLEEKVFGAPRG